MTTDPCAAARRDLLLRHLGTWLSTLHRSRRATFVQAYAGADAGTADAALRVIAASADLPSGCHLTVVTLAGPADGGPAAGRDPLDLATRLGAAQAALPAGVSVHLLPGGAQRIPVALAAASAARAPLFVYLDHVAEQVPDPTVWRAMAAGHPTEILLLSTAGARGAGGPSSAPDASELPLVTMVDLVPGSDPAGGLVPGIDPAGGPGPDTALGLFFATTSGKRIEAVKDAIWSVAAGNGMTLRDPRLTGGPSTQDPPPGSMTDRSGSLPETLLARLTRTGPLTVAELRRFAVTETIHRAADANRAVAELLAAGAARRRPEHGRLGGDVTIEPAVTPAIDTP
ncbi:hypothetical protein O7632_22285 [Solwaraspora sp. WMMD406]|uniref:hypothetical protein n=1 Tax=Solwaraspora sp. WMMD406 TaxID=3016095 RepID=UPI002415D442|nr:hypothetical protein [Solwaraspora sp. WMMD406]MDG4766806.1 hypothetical protein [Solwaraspora sp. WMMD406]